VLLLLRAELVRLRPAEILIPENLELQNELPGHTPLAVLALRNRALPGSPPKTVPGCLPGCFGLRGMGMAVRAAGAILQYIQETQPAALKLLTGLNTYSTDEFMTIDASTRRNLELTETIRQGEEEGSLLSVLDRTVTPMGRRLVRQWVSKPCSI